MSKARDSQSVSRPPFSPTAIAGAMRVQQWSLVVRHRQIKLQQSVSVWAEHRGGAATGGPTVPRTVVSRARAQEQTQTQTRRVTCHRSLLPLLVRPFFSPTVCVCSRQGGRFSRGFCSCFSFLVLPLLSFFPFSHSLTRPLAYLIHCLCTRRWIRQTDTSPRATALPLPHRDSAQPLVSTDTFKSNPLRCCRPRLSRPCCPCGAMQPHDAVEQSRFGHTAIVTLARCTLLERQSREQSGFGFGFLPPQLRRLRRIAAAVSWRCNGSIQVDGWAEGVN